MPDPTLETSEFDFHRSGEPWMSITNKTFSNVSSSGELLVESERRGGTSINLHSTLPLPNELIFQTELDWAVESKSPVQQLGQNWPEAMQALSKENLAQTTRNLFERVKSVAGSPAGANWYLQRQGVALNPMKGVFFNGVNHRQFTWTWDFAPKNAAEAKAITEFFNRIEQASLPDVSEDELLFRIPDAFEIQFDPTLKLPKIFDCVCVSMTPNFTGAGNPRFQKDGYASFMQFTLAFLELSIRTRDKA